MSWPFANGRMTPRHAEGSSDPVAFQASCFCHEACNKSLSASMVGGDIGMARRMLQYWLVLGPSYLGKAPRKEAWKIVQTAFREGEVPTEALLEVCAASLLRREDAPSVRVSKKASALELPETPPDVRERCQRLLAAGVLPVTTPAVRRRNRPQPGNLYGKPPHLTEAFRWGYTSPNLPNPRDSRWLLQRGDWVLNMVPRGG